MSDTVFGHTGVTDLTGIVRFVFHWVVFSFILLLLLLDGVTTGAVVE